MVDTARRTFTRNAVTLACLGARALPSRANEPFPTRPMRLLVGFPPGGSVDLVARAIVAKLDVRLPERTVVENRPGAAGNIAAGLLVKAAPDGYTSYVATSVNAVSPYLYKDIQYDPGKDFAPIGRWITTSYMMVVGAKQPIKSLKDFIKYASSHPGKVNFGSQGIGSPPHLAGELLSLRTGVKMVHVPFKGGPEVMSAVLAGEIQVTFAPIPIALPLVKSGKLRLLGMTGLTRSTLVPDTPTLAEEGLNDFNVISWYGWVAPSGTPRSVIEMLSRQSQAVLALPDVRKTLLTQGMEPAPLNPEAFAKFIADEMRNYATLTAEAGISRV